MAFPRKGFLSCWSVHLLLIGIWTNLAAAGPLSSSSLFPDLSLLSRCSRECPLTNPDSPQSKGWHYEVGQSYQYSYETVTETSMRGTSDDRQVSWVRIRATANVDVISSCEFRLKLSDVSTDDGSNEFTAVLEREPISFSFDDGKISDLCSSSEDPVWAANFRRGILSAFQNEFLMDGEKGRQISETDVVGTCDTIYSSFPSSDADGVPVMFKKEKLMKSCKNNQKLHQNALNLPDVNMQKFPLLVSSHVCTYGIVDQRLQFVECKEVHAFKPFSSGDNGATTQQTQTLTFIKKSEISDLDMTIKWSSKKSLAFENPVANEDSSDVQDIFRQVKTFLSLPESQRPRLFGWLVHEMRRLKFHQLYDLFLSLEDARLRRFALDAVPLLRTEDSVQFMVDRLRAEKELSADRKDRWFSALALYKNPTRAMLAAMAPLLEEDPRASALLGISVLTSTFCQANPNCGDVQEVQEVISGYERLLGVNCYSMGAEEEDRVVLSLKALRNIGHVKASSKVLEKCYTEFSNPMEIRLAALDTIKLLNCKSGDFGSGLTSLFRNQEQDSELRIAAYLALMSCPDKCKIDMIKGVLEREEVNQVGSFIWTHLTNLQESKSLTPSKKYLKSIIGNDFLKNKWNTDVRKFSRYFETSYFSPDLDAGATVDGSLVFSADSYIPRSAMFNLTANVFGESLNLFEVGGRVEGFEDLVESMFGPDGYFREDALHKLLQGMRSKRDVRSNEIAGFQQTFNHRKEEEPRGNVYARVFGKDVFYDSFHGLRDLMSSINGFSGNIFTSPEVTMEFERSSVFLDGEIVLATASGFPLSVSVNGSYNVDLKTSLKLNVTNFFVSGDATLVTEIYPTTTVEVVGMMSVDAVVAKTGLKSVSKLHSNTFLDGSLKIQGNKLVTAHINMPKDSVEVLEASVDFFTYEDGEFVVLESSNNVEQAEVCSPSIVSDILALEACGSFKYHSNQAGEKSQLMFAGPSKLRLNVRKTDVFHSYVFEYAWNANKRKQHDANLSNFRVSLNTPGSQRRHESSLEVLYDAEFYSFISVDVKAPYKDLSASAKYEWTDRRKQLKATLQAQGQNVALVNVAFKTETPGSYVMAAKVSYLDNNIVNWTGNLNVQNSKASLVGKLQSVYHDSVLISGDWQSDENYISLSSTIQSSPFNMNLSSQIRLERDSASLKGDVSYNVRGGLRQLAKVNGKFRTLQIGLLSKLNYFLSIQHPLLNTEISWDFQRSEGYISNAGKLKVGDQIYIFEQLYSSRQTPELDELLFKIMLANLAQGSEYKVEYNQKHSPNASKLKLGASYGRHFRFESHLSHLQTDDPFSQDISAGLTLPGHSYQAGFSLLEKQSDSTDFTGHAFLSWGEQETQKLKADFGFKRGNVANKKYELTLDLAILGWNKLHVDGALTMLPTKSLARVTWSHGLKLYKLELEHSPIGNGLEYGIHAKLVMNNIAYEGVIVYRFDEIMNAIQADIKMEKHLVFTLITQNNYRDVTLNFAWDKDVDDSKKLALQTKFFPSSWLAKFEVPDYNGMFELTFETNGWETKARYNDLFLDTLGEWTNTDGLYGIRGTINSSWSELRDVRVIARHSLTHEATKAVMQSRIVLQKNEIRHSIIVDGASSSSGTITGKLVTSSTYQLVHDIKAQMLIKSKEKALEAHLKVNYQNMDLASASFNAKSASDVNLKVRTLFAPLKMLEASYKIDSDTIEVKAKHNEVNRLSVFAKEGEFDLEGNVETYFSERAELKMLLSTNRPQKNIEVLVSYGEKALGIKAGIEMFKTYQLDLQWSNADGPTDIKLLLTADKLTIEHNEEKILSALVERPSPKSFTVLIDGKWLLQSFKVSVFKSDEKNGFKLSYVVDNVEQSQAIVLVSKDLERQDGFKATAMQVLFKTNPDEAPLVMLSGVTKSSKNSNSVEGLLQIRGQMMNLKLRDDRDRIIPTPNVVGSRLVVANLQTNLGYFANTQIVFSGTQFANGKDEKKLHVLHEGKEIRAKFESTQSKQNSNFVFESSGDLLAGLSSWKMTRESTEVGDFSEQRIFLTSTNSNDHSLSFSSFMDAKRAVKTVSLAIKSPIIETVCGECGETVLAEIKSERFSFVANVTAGSNVINGNLDFNNQNVSGQATISLPSADLAEIKASFNVKTISNGFIEADAHVEKVNDHQIFDIFVKASSQKLSGDAVSSFKAQINTPVHGWEEVLVELTFDPAHKEKKLEAILRRAEFNLVYKLFYSRDANHFKASSTLHCPGHEISVDAEMQHSQNYIRQWRSDFTWNDRLHGATGTLRLEDGTGSFQANLFAKRKEGSSWTLLSETVISSSFAQLSNGIAFDLVAASDTTGYNFNLTGMLAADWSSNIRFYGDVPILRLENVDAAANSMISREGGKISLDSSGGRILDLVWEEKNQTRSIKIKVSCSHGDYSVSAQVNKNNNAASFKLETPREELRLVWLEYALASTAIKLHVQHNDRVLSLKGSLSDSFEIGEASLVTQLRFYGLPDAKAELAYNFGRSISKHLRLNIQVENVGLLMLNAEYEEGKLKLICISPWTGSKELISSWSLEQGHAKISATVDKRFVLESTAQFDLAHFQDFGQVAFTLRTNWVNFRELNGRDLQLNAELSYDFTKEERDASLLLQWIDFQLLTKSLFVLTEDSMQSKTSIKSSSSILNDVDLSVAYNIKARPEATVTYERGGIQKVFKIQVNLETVIPTVNIVTPFEGFERITLSGTFQDDNGLKLVDFQLRKNGQLMANVTTKILMKPNNFWLDGKIRVPRFSSLNADFNLEVNVADPYVGRLSILHGTDLYKMDVELSLDNPELSVEVKSPFEGFFRSILLMGKTGTTTIGQSMGVSFENNNQRRELGLDYGFGEKEAFVSVRTPFENLRSISVHKREKRDEADEQPSLEFDFETQGQNNDLNFGVSYNFDLVKKSGKLRAFLSSPTFIPESLGSMEFLLTVNKNKKDNLSGSIDFETSFSYAGGTYQVTTEVSKQNLNLNIQSPIEGYTKLGIQLKTDYESIAEASFEMEEETYSLKLEVIEKGQYQAILTTPIEWLNELKVTVKGSGLVFRIVVERNEKIESTLDVEVNPDLENNSGTVNIHWAADDLSATLKAGWTKGNSGYLELNTPFKEVKFLRLDFDYSKVYESNFSGRETSNFKANWNNEHSYDYAYFKTFNSSGFDSKTTVTTNIPWFRYNEEVTTVHVETNPDIHIPRKLLYKVITDKVLKYDIRFEFEETESGFKSKFAGEIVEFNIHFEGHATVTTVERIKADVEIIASMEGFTTVAVQAMYEVNDDDIKYDHGLLIKVEADHHDLAKLYMNLQMRPFPKLFVEYQDMTCEPSGCEQTLEASFRTSAKGQEVRAEADINVRGIYVDFSWEGSVEQNFKLMKTLFETTWQGEDKYFELDIAPFKKTFLFDLDMSERYLVVNFKEPDIKYNHILRISGLSSQLKTVDVGVDFQTTYLSPVAAQLKWNFAKKKKSADVKFTLDQFFTFIFKSEVDWTPWQSDIKLGVEVNGQRVKFVAKREKYLKNFKYEFSGLGRTFKLQGSNKMSCFKDLDINVRLESTNFGLEDWIFQLRTSEEAETVKLRAFAKYGLVELTVELDLREQSFDHTLKVDVKDMSKSDHALTVLAFSAIMSENEEEIVLEVALKLCKEIDEKVTISSNIVHWMRKTQASSDLYLKAVTDDANKLDIVFNLRKKTLQANLKSQMINIDSLFAVTENQEGQRYKMEAKLNQEDPLVVELVLGNVANRVSQFDVNYGSSHIISAKAKYEKTESTRRLELLELSFAGTSRTYSGVLAYSKSESEKSLSFQVKSNTKEASLFAVYYFETAKWQLKVTTSSPKLKNILIEVSREESGATTKLYYNVDEANQVKIDAKISLSKDAALLSVTSEAAKKVLLLKTELDFSEKKLTVLNLLDDKELFSLTSALTENGITVDINSIHDSFKKVQLQGTWEPTPNGAKLQATGSVDSETYQFVADYILAENELLLLKWRASRGAKEIAFSLSFQFPNISTRTVICTFEVDEDKSELKFGYNIEDIYLHVNVEFDSPYKNVGGGKFTAKLGVDQAQGLDLKASAFVSGRNTPGGPVKVFDVEVTAMMKLQRDIVLRCILEIPALNIDYKDFEIEFVFSVGSWSDFDLASSFKVGRQQLIPIAYEYGVRYKYDGARLEAGVKGSYGHDRKADFVSLKVEATTMENSLEIGAEASGFGRTILADVECRRDDEGVKLTITGDCNPMGDTERRHDLSIGLALRLHPGVAVKAEAKYRDCFDLNVAVNGAFVEGKIEIKISELAQKVARFRGEVGTAGNFELTVSDGASKVRVKRDGRKVEASFDAPEFGQFELGFGDGKSGILFLKTDAGIHKLSYSVKSAFDFRVDLSSPYLSESSLTLVMLLDQNYSVYKGSFSSAEQVFMSGSFEKKSDYQFQLLASLSFPYLPFSWASFFSKLELNSKLQVNEGVAMLDLTANKLGKEHAVKLSLNIPKHDFSVLLKSPLLSKTTAEASCRLQEAGKLRRLTAKLQWEDFSMSVAGAVTVRDAFNWKGSANVESTHPIVPNLTGTFEMRTNESKVERLILDFVVLDEDAARWSLRFEDEDVTDASAIKRISVRTGLSFAPFAKVEWRHREAELVSLRASMPCYSNLFSIGECRLNLTVSNINVDAELFLPRYGEILFRAEVPPSEEEVSIELFLQLLEQKITTNIIIPRASWRKFNIRLDVSDNYGNDIKSEILFDTINKISLEGHLQIQYGKPLEYPYGHPSNRPIRLLIPGSYEFRLVLENSARKTFILLCQSPEMRSLGFILDYYFNSIQDFNLDWKMDWPFEWVKLRSLRISNMNGPNQRAVGAAFAFDDWLDKAILYQVELREGLELLTLQVKWNREKHWIIQERKVRQWYNDMPEKRSFRLWIELFQGENSLGKFFLGIRGSSVYAVQCKVLDIVDMKLDARSSMTLQLFLRDPWFLQTTLQLQTFLSKRKAALYINRYPILFAEFLTSHDTLVHVTFDLLRFQTITVSFDTDSYSLVGLQQGRGILFQHKVTKYDSFLSHTWILFDHVVALTTDKKRLASSNGLSTYKDQKILFEWGKVRQELEHVSIVWTENVNDHGNERVATLKRQSRGSINTLALRASVKEPGLLNAEVTATRSEKKPTGGPFLFLYQKYSMSASFNKINNVLKGSCNVIDIDLDNQTSIRKHYIFEGGVYSTDAANQFTGFVKEFGGPGQILLDFTVNNQFPSVSSKVKFYGFADLDLSSFVGIESENRMAFNYSVTNGQKLSQANLSINLTESNSLISEAKYDLVTLKELTSDLKVYLRNNVDSISWNGLSVDEWRRHGFLFKPLTDFLKFCNASVQYVSENSNMLNRIKDIYLEHVPTLQLLVHQIQDIWQGTMKIPAAIVSGLLSGSELFTDYQRVILNSFLQTLKKCIIYGIDYVNIDWDNASLIVEDSIFFFRNGLEKVNNFFTRLTKNRLSKLGDCLRQMLELARRDILRFMSEGLVYLQQFHFMREVVETYVEYQSWFEEIHFTQKLEKLLDKLTSSFKFTINFLTSAYKNACDMWKDSVNFIAQQYNTLTSSTRFQFISSIFDKISKFTSMLFRKYTSRDIKQLLKGILDQTEAISSTLLRLIHVAYYGDAFISYEFTFKPEEHYLLYKQVLPIDWDSFLEPPKIVKLLTTSPEQSDFDFVDFQHQLLDAINTVNNAIETRNVMPPFSAHAIITADASVHTFDGRMFTFHGDCSYLLVADFLRNKFSVVGNFKEGRKQSVTITRRDRIVEVSSDLKVTLNNRLIGLPLVVEGIFVQRVGSKVVVEIAEGLRVQCNEVYGVCSVTISGWYFGKTGGLFGNYDNEPSNDLMTPERNLVTDVSQFVSSWQVSNNGESCWKQTNSILDQDISTADLETCQGLFEQDTSALMPCFATVGTDAFARMCRQDMRRAANHPNKEEAPCSSAAAYIEFCRLKGVELWMPAQCISCQKEDRSVLRGGESMSYQSDAPRSADVVFLLERRQCLSGYHVSHLPRMIDETLEGKLLTGNRFAVVGFGGAGDLRQPHIFTDGSVSIFGKRETAENNLQRLWTENATSEDPGDIFSALQFAGRLSFRPGVSKTFILLTCSGNSAETDGSFYGDAMTMIVEQNITLHHLLEDDFAFKSKWKKASSVKMFGISREEAFTSEAGTMSSSLRRQLRPSKSFISTLALESGGVVFTLQRFRLDETALAKQAGAALAERVGVRAEPSPCQVCDCIADKDGRGGMQCHKCILPQIDIVLQNWHNINS